jgi:hypothetical protein
MPAELRLVWSAPAQPERGHRPLEARAPSPTEAEARALVDGWVSTPFENGSAALEQLVVQIAAALACRDARVGITAPLIPLADWPDPS